MQKTSILVILALLSSTDSLKLADDPEFDAQSVRYQPVPMEYPLKYYSTVDTLNVSGDKIPWDDQNRQNPSTNYRDYDKFDQNQSTARRQASFDDRFRRRNLFKQEGLYEMAHDDRGSHQDSYLDDPRQKPWNSWFTSDRLDWEEQDKRNREIDAAMRHEQEENARQMRSQWSDGFQYSPDYRWRPDSSREEAASRYLQSSTLSQPVDISERYKKDVNSDSSGITCMLDPASCEKGTMKKQEEVIAKPKVTLKMHPDGLLHGPDGRRWALDGVTEVNGVNNYAQLNQDETVQQITQIDMETMEERTGIAAEVRKIEADSQAREEAREETRQKVLSMIPEEGQGVLMKDGSYHLINKLNQDDLDQDSQQIARVNSS